MRIEILKPTLATREGSILKSLKREHGGFDQEESGKRQFDSAYILKPEPKDFL